MAKKSSSTFEQKDFLEDFTSKCEVIIGNFTNMIASIAPNKIDLNQIKSATAIGKTLRELEKSGSLLINPNGPRSVKIESLDGVNASKIYKSASSSLMDIGFQVADHGSYIIVNMQAMTEDIRKEMIKQVKTLKENFKQQINNFRGDLHKGLKNFKLSEDLENSTKNEIDKIKDKYQKKLETDFVAKENAILKG